MIIDRIDNLAVYERLGGRLGEALRYLRTQPIEALEPGKYEISGEDIFLLIQSYETRQPEQGFWEAHNKYTDIQCMLEGEERMGWAHRSRLRQTEDHLAEKDYVVLEGEGDEVLVPAGTFTVFFPEDAHMPCMAAGQPAYVKKAVFKVRCDDGGGTGA